MNNLVDKTWHLAKNEEETKLTDFEFQLWRVFYGFTRWQEGCERVANQTDLTGSELSLLHIIRMKDRPKTISELTRLLNRGGSAFNINYSIQKLIKNGLIRKLVDEKNNKKAFSYEITEEGIKNTDAYTALRQNILIELFKKKKELNLEQFTSVLSELIALYEEADRAVLAYYGK
ncbi:winged helix DNA-binding protein [Rickettsiella endosymbiont of Xylota segnis]|jgi:predicted MarR family transcription regulator|uniref:winged helix DNA-binding protein n=1 Tax=Rickettsiella endosymbiont of Xylota segnis TaxID=3066238 RepID=UPI0030D1BB0A